MISGTCHCKQISFEIDENKLCIRYCYCTTCRKLSGADYSSVAGDILGGTEKGQSHQNGNHAGGLVGSSSGNQTDYYKETITKY
jgi:hypothetical protein